MKHLFKCVECGEFFEKKGAEVVCGVCATAKESHDNTKKIEVQDKKKATKKK